MKTVRYWLDYVRVKFYTRKHKTRISFAELKARLEGTDGHQTGLIPAENEPALYRMMNKIVARGFNLSAQKEPYNAVFPHEPSYPTTTNKGEQ